MSERKFARALRKPGMAAQLRETMSQVVRETSSHVRCRFVYIFEPFKSLIFLQNAAPEGVEPLDYEAFILKNRTLLQNDPQRELLLYPSDDVSV